MTRYERLAAIFALSHSVTVQIKGVQDDLKKATEAVQAKSAEAKSAADLAKALEEERKKREEMERALEEDKKKREAAERGLDEERKKREASDKAAEEEKKKREAAERALEEERKRASVKGPESARAGKQNEEVVLKTFDLLRESEARCKELKETIAELELGKQLLESELQSTKVENAKLREAPKAAEARAPAPASSGAAEQLAALTERQATLMKIVKEYVADMDLENSRIKEAQERHKEALKKQRRDGSSASIADAEEAYRVASEELMTVKDKATLVEDYFAQIERVLQGKSPKPQVSATSTGSVGAYSQALCAVLCECDMLCCALCFFVFFFCSVHACA